MQFGGGFFSPMFRLIDAIGHKLNRGRTYRVNHAFEASRKALVRFAAKRRTQGFEMIEHRPE